MTSKRTVIKLLALSIAMGAPAVSFAGPTRDCDVCPPEHADSEPLAPADAAVARSRDCDVCPAADDLVRTRIRLTGHATERGG